MRGYLDSDTSTMYNKTIERVIKAMTSTMIHNNYSEDTLKKIQSMWKDNINKAPRSKFAHIAPFKLEQKKVPVPEPIIEKPPSPIILKAKSPPPADLSSSEDFSEEEEEADPIEHAYHALKVKKEEEEKKTKELKAEPIQSESEDDIQASDDETNLDYPEPTGIIHCLHDGVKRKGNDWTITIKSCVYQEVGKPESFFRSAQSKFHFIDNNRR